MAPPSTTYAPGDPTSTVLYGIVRDHFETFRAQAASLRNGDGLPRFVEQEFRDFLRCGCLAGGFARFRCAACGLADRSSVADVCRKPWTVRQRFACNRNSKTYDPQEILLDTRS